MQRTIMTVDDSTSMRQMVKATLISAGYGVVEAADGQEALDYARENPVDLVIADVNMPRMDGITLVSELRSLPTYRLTPVLLLTTESSMDKKMEGKKAGATGWLVKPFHPAQLLATLARIRAPPGHRSLPRRHSQLTPALRAPSGASKESRQRSVSFS